LIRAARGSRSARLVATSLAVLAVVAFLGVRASAAFDHQRHLDEARAVLEAPNVITRRLPPTAAGRAEGVSGTLQFRPHAWLSVLSFQGLPPVSGDERYLVFLQNWGGWLLAGATRPSADGSAQVRFAAEPRPATIYEVLVTRDVDDATSLPHGAPVLHWFGRRQAPHGAIPFDLDRLG
jgi:hypothetical protein